MSAEEAPVLTLLAEMTADSLEATTLDDRSVMIARLAALIAVGAPAGSYLLNMGVAGESGIDTEQVQGLLTAIAPIVGTARIVAAAGNMVKAFDREARAGRARRRRVEAAASPGKLRTIRDAVGALVPAYRSERPDPTGG